MTEVPDHLLQRSRERRKALGLPVAAGDDAGDAGGGAAPTASADAPVPAAAAASAPSRPAPVPVAAAPPPPPRPMPPYVVAAHTRKRIPVWAMPVLAGLPLWAFLFATTLSPPSAGENDPLAVGKEVYDGKCASCHGATGGGGVGPALTGGDVLLTFPDPLDHLAWIELGAEGANEDGTYGDPNRPQGQRNVDTFAGQMPGFANSLTPEEIIAVTRYEREGLSGAEPEAELAEAGEGAGSGAGPEQQGNDTGTPTTADDAGGQEGTEGGEGSTEDSTGTGG